MSSLNPSPSPSERFIVLAGTLIEPWVAHDEILKMDRAAAVAFVASGEVASISRVIGFDLERGTCRDATGEIASAVMDRWADAGEFLSSWQYEFVELHVGVIAARGFVCGRAA